MKKRYIGFGVFLLMLMLIILTAHGEVTAPAMDQTIVSVHPGETVQFTYSVPEGFVVESEEWHWSYGFTDGYHYILGDEPDESDPYATWNDAGGISLSRSGMVRVFVILNHNPAAYTLTAHATFSDPENAFEYEIRDGKAVITGRHDEQLRELIVIPSDIGGYPVTAIGDEAFEQLPSGTGGWIFIPDTVTSIGREAFAGSAYLDFVRRRG